MTQTDAQIYIADQRGVSETTASRSFHTFNFGSYQHPGREPKGDILALHDNTLFGHGTSEYPLTQELLVLLLPVHGNVQYQSSPEIQGTLRTGECHFLVLPRHTTLRILNLQPQLSARVIQVWFALKSPLVIYRKAGSHCFDFDKHADQLISLFGCQMDEFYPRVFIGRYGGRVSGAHVLYPGSRGAFIQVLDGAFEVAERLLQAGDALWLQQPNEIEFEALSTTATLLIIESPRAIVMN